MLPDSLADSLIDSDSLVKVLSDSLVEILSDSDLLADSLAALLLLND